MNKSNVSSGRQSAVKSIGSRPSSSFQLAKKSDSENMVLLGQTATNAAPSSKRKEYNMFLEDDGGNEGDREDGGDEKTRGSSSSKPITPFASFAFSESESEDGDAATRYNLRHSARSKTPKTVSVTVTPTKEKSKRKRFPEDETPSTSVSRKRMLRGKTPSGNDLLSETKQNPQNDTTPVASKINDHVFEKNMTSTSDLVKPVAVRPAPPVSEITRSLLALPSTNHLSTPKPVTDSAFKLNRFSSVTKSIVKDVEMDEFFNSPTAKSLQAMGSNRKRSSSPTPIKPSNLSSFNMMTCIGSDSSSENTTTDFGSLGSDAESFWPNRRPAPKSRQLFADRKGVDSLVDRMSSSVLETPQKGGKQISLRNQSSAFIHKCLQSSDADDELGIPDSKAAFSLLGNVQEESTDTEYESDISLLSSKGRLKSALKNVEIASPHHEALVLVFKFMLAEEMDLCKLVYVSKEWKKAVQQVLWEKPVFRTVASMFTMHKIIHGYGYPSSSSQSTLNASHADKDKKTGVRGILGIHTCVDPSSPRRLLFQDHSIPTPPAKEVTYYLPNKSLAHLVKSVSFNLFLPTDRRFPPMFDIQSFLVDTFPNLSSLSLAGAPQWINPYFLARLTSQPRIRKNLETLELLSGAMDKLTSDETTPQETAAQLLRKLKGLKKFVVNESRSLDDNMLRLIGEGSTGLEELSLTCCNSVTDAGVAWIVESCKKLRSLEISYCAKVGDGFFRSMVYSAVQNGGISQLKSLKMRQNRLGLLTEEGLLSLVAPKRGSPIVKLSVLYLESVSLSNEGVLRISNKQPALESFVHV
ncbi:hypothetical protein HDU79_008178 [Rhizoclosmatium sp. JEL0117]|nr:hypothetical protein HDU79_008178 [Rhizoclosmatium sp. JEL0117]